MKELEGYYIDENNNRWDKNLYSIEEAKSYSKSLFNCTECNNCKNCNSCINSTKCIHCMHCNNCNNCTDCIDCHNCINCYYCNYCTSCEKCMNCKTCTKCKDYKYNPMRIVSNRIGSRRDNTTVYWLKDNIQVLCGCFRGDLDAFKDAVNNTHNNKNNKIFYDEYIKFIKLVEYNIKHM